jgi:hypothetical protein
LFVAHDINVSDTIKVNIIHFTFFNVVKVGRHSITANVLALGAVREWLPQISP